MAEKKTAPAQANKKTIHPAPEDARFNRSVALEKIIADGPPFLVSWSGFIFLFVIVLIIIAGNVIRYPDIISLPVRIYCITPPASVVSSLSGKLILSPTMDPAHVRSGETLGEVISTGSHHETLKASIDGVLAPYSFIRNGDNIQSNQILFFIYPLYNEYYAELTFGNSTDHEMMEGQRVRLQFASHPASTVIGRITSAIQHGSSDERSVRIILTEGLVTTQGQRIKFHEGLQAEAELITTEIRLIDRWRFRCP